MASRSENADIAVLQDQVGNMQNDLGEIKGDVKSIMASVATMPQHFVTTEEFAAYRIAQELAIKDLRKRSWAENTLSAIAGVVLTTLISTIIYILFIHTSTGPVK